MSGGYFDYNQYRIGQMVDEIEQIIEYNDSDELDEWGDTKGRHYDEEVIEHFKDAAYVLKRAQIYAHRIDWLLCGDDGPDNFIKRLNEELEKLEEPK